MIENDNNYYDPEQTHKPWLKIILLIIAIVIIILLVIVLSLKSSNKTNVNLYEDMYNSTKKYLEANKDSYPVAIGSCQKVSLNTLSDQEMVSNLKNYKKCDYENTYVDVCKISSNEYQYTPILACDDVATTFDDWKYGNLDELKQNNSEIKFSYIAEELKNGYKLYYPNDKENVVDVSEYYVKAPALEYSYIDTANIAYKWYSESNGKEYYQDGKYTSTQPEGYVEHEPFEKKSIGYTEKPDEKENRVIEPATLYATEYVAYPYKYECYDTKITGKVFSDTVCELRNEDTFTKTKKIFYTCDGKTEVASETICKERTDWEFETCKDKSQTKSGHTKDGYDYTRQVSTGKTCITVEGYKVTEEVAKWYKTGNIKKYYPSNKNNAADENTYYVNVPVGGAIKDEETKTIAYRYYKFVSDDKKDKVWVSIADSLLTEQEMIDKFKDIGYDVKSLEEIEKNENIRYQIVVSYRDRK